MFWGRVLTRAVHVVHLCMLFMHVIEGILNTHSGTYKPGLQKTDFLPVQTDL